MQRRAFLVLSKYFLSLSPSNWIILSDSSKFSTTENSIYFCSASLPALSVLSTTSLYMPALSIVTTAVCTFEPSSLVNSGVKFFTGSYLLFRSLSKSSILVLVGSKFSSVIFILTSPILLLTLSVESSITGGVSSITRFSSLLQTLPALSFAIKCILPLYVLFILKV